MAGFKTLDDIGDVAGKRVLVRADLNVPMTDGRVADASRLEASRATILELARKGAVVIVMSHFGRPKGKADPELSLERIAAPLAEAIGRSVKFVGDDAALSELEAGEVALIENLRFDPGEEANDPDFAQSLADKGDVYVNDAFSAAHRAHASTEGVAHLLPAYAGRQMERELTALEAALGDPERPVAAIVGGAKVSTKLDVLRNLIERVDHLMIGGGMANTLLAAKGIDVGKSLCEHELADTAREIMDKADEKGVTLHLPYEVVVADEFEAHALCRAINVNALRPGEMILDLGPAAVEAWSDALKTCRTVIWNGPVGAFEIPPFDRATVALAKTVAALTQSRQLLSVAGGGDTLAALNHAGVADRFSFVSTAGGAFLEWMEGKALPGVEALKS